MNGVPREEEHLEHGSRRGRDAVRGGAAGAVHGAMQAGALTTSFTASQGLPAGHHVGVVAEDRQARWWPGPAVRAATGQFTGDLVHVR